MSGVPMSSDAGHRFSGGSVDEACTRCGATPETGLREGCPECEGIVPAFSGGALSERGRTHGQPRDEPRSESVSYEAAECLGGTGDWRVLEVGPGRCVEDSHWPTMELAQSYALALNRWLDQRPTVVSPFFAPLEAWPEPERAEPSFEGLEAIFERGERPERMGL